MSDTTGIEWTDSTWNPIRGCSRVSEGCRNCYAEKVAYRFSDEGQAYHGLVGIGGKWNGKIKFVEDHLLDPLRWKKPRRIFVNSMSDLFHENVTDEMRDKIFAVMALCPQHTFQVLTKRPERMRSYLTSHGRTMQVYGHAVSVIEGDFAKMPKQMAHHRSSGAGWWPLPNVWLGVSVEDQKTADQRIPLLLQTPAAVRFISAEPLLGDVNLVNVNAMVWFRECMAKINPHEAMRQANSDFYPKHCPMDVLTGECVAIVPALQERIDWVIVGGESGPHARPMHPDWARSLRDQCVAAGVPFFFKQWGEWCPAKLRHVEGCVGKTNGRYWFDPDPTGKGEIRRLGKKAAGHLLDGAEWHQFPATEVQRG